MLLCAVFGPVAPPLGALSVLAADWECTVVSVVVRERRDGAGLENVESALCIVDCPTPVTPVFPLCPAVDFAVVCAVAIVGATLRSPLLCPFAPSREERKEAALSCARFCVDVKEAVRRVGRVDNECW